jgi:serine/threonine protein kinase
MNTTLINNQYSYVRDLGTGGMSKVFLVRDAIGGELCACKKIPKSLDPKKFHEQKIKDNINDIKNEIEIMKKLKGKPGVIELYNHFEDNDFVYLMMETCMGGTIYDFMEKSIYTRELTVKLIIKQVLQILWTIHCEDILHNDIKPENFLLKNENDIKSLHVLDFGTAMDDKHQRRTSMFTPWYMSVESLSSIYCKKSDVWQVGIMTYYLLSNLFPFNDKSNPLNPSVYSIWHSILKDDVNFQKPVWNLYSNEARDFIRHLLEKDVDKRFTVLEALYHPWIFTT